MSGLKLRHDFQVMKRMDLRAATAIHRKIHMAHAHVMFAGLIGSVLGLVSMKVSLLLTAAYAAHTAWLHRSRIMEMVMRK